MKIFKILLSFASILILAAYLGLWVYSAQWFEREIDRVYVEAAENDIEFLGPKPRMSNFPFVPEVDYSSGVKIGVAEILFPQMILRGYPLPGATLTAKFPLGIMLGGIVDPKVWEVDYMEAGIAVPSQLPATAMQEDLTAWKDSGGMIDVRHYEIRKNLLTADGKGLLKLDNALQPEFNMESTIRGYEAFIEEQLQQGKIEQFPAAIARGVFGSLARPDEKTGENVVNINVSVSNRMLRVGPVLVLELPEILWDTRTPPAPAL